MSADARTLNLFERALEIEAPRRAAWLERECGADTALRAEVEALLAADAAAEGFLAEPIGADLGRSGERLGAYRLTQLIGHGGMGSVYRAERADGAFAKPVAIKLLLFDAGDLRTRFALEQRILGALSHPNIASLLDVGHDARGAPYLIMEYVEGETIAAYVQRRALDLRTRIDLFRKVVDAVQHAHRHLIVHRDIKPSNVLVDAHGEPKLLDFGIAKLLGDDTPAMTRTGLGPLTPEYASPEQVRGDPIGTASDIYSLGVLLFELVAGERPYRIEHGRASAIERVVCDTDPPRPSTIAGAVHGGGNASDLDAIVLKALAKQPARRYASCAAFAEDLGRWLERREVLARHPPWSERTWRTLKRYRLASAVIATASITLVAGSAAALWQAHRAQQQADIARSERDRAQRINRFLTDTLAAANPADLGRKATVVDVLERARRLADKELAEDAQSAASAQLVLAESFRSLGDFDAAQACGEAAVAAARRSGDDSVLIEAESALGNVFLDKSNLSQARAMYEQAREHARAHGTAMQRAMSALELGQVANEEGNGAQAKTWLTLALAELPREAVLERATALDSSGFAADLAGDKRAAIALRRQAIAELSQAFPHGHPVLTSLSVNLAQALQKNGELDEAVQILGDVLPRQVETLGEYHSDVVWTLTTLTSIERKRNRLDGALGYARRAYDVAQHLSDDNDWKAYAFEKYGDVLIAAEQPADAVPILDKALAIDRAMLPADHQSIAAVEGLLALAHSRIDGRPSGAAQAQAAYDRLLAKYGATSDFTLAAKSRLEQILALGQPGAAATR